MSIAVPYAGKGSAIGTDMPSASPLHNNSDSQSPARNNLQQITAQTRLSTLTPRIEAVLREMTGPSGTLLTALSCNVEALQEGFIEALYSVFVEEKIDLSEKITLRLHAGTLVVSDEHVHKEQMNAVLASNPDLSAAFREIASQSEILRDIGNITKVMNRQAKETLPISTCDKSIYSVYQMSLKGEMSHFYFAKT